MWPVLLLEHGEGGKEGMRRGGEEERKHLEIQSIEGTH